MTHNQKKKILRLTDGKPENNVHDLKLAPGQYKKLNLLARGGQAEVWLWRRLSDDLLLAVKTYRKEERDWQDDMPMERYILQEVLPPNPRIVTCHKFRTLANGQLEMVFGYCGGGDLRQFVRPAKTSLPEDFLWHIFIQMADALALLQETLTLTASADYGHNQKGPGTKSLTGNPVVHAAVKPSNIFCRQKYILGGQFPSLVLGNFSTAFLGPYHSSGGGPSMFQPPEYPFISAKADVWGLGATIHALAHGQEAMLPMSKADHEAMDSAPSGEERAKLRHAWLSKTKLRYIIDLPEGYSRELDFCIKKCLRSERAQRIDSMDLVTLLSAKKSSLQGKASTAEGAE